MKKRFTLIELIIVIIVIGILAAMALPKFMGVQRNAKVGAMQRDLDTIEKAVQQYLSSTTDGDYPFKDLNGDNQINEDDLYFKTNPVPQTLTDSLLLSGDDGSEIYQLDMNKLKPYIEKLKYKDTEYVYSPKSETAIDPVGKVDSEDNTHHIIGSGLSDENNTNDNITKSIKMQINNSILFSDNTMITFNDYADDFEQVTAANSTERENVQKMYEKTYYGLLYLQDNRLKLEDEEVLDFDLNIDDEVYFGHYDDSNIEVTIREKSGILKSIIVPFEEEKIGWNTRLKFPNRSNAIILESIEKLSQEDIFVYSKGIIKIML